jgi:hypothetical protein
MSVPVCLIMNLRERCQTVFQARYQLGINSFRALALKTNLSKSSIHRLYHRIIKRNQYPESSLWETKEGQEWLRLLVLAAIFIFALQGGIGCERLSGFFHLLRLERHIGVSPTALRSLRARMESTIIEYQQRQNEIIGKISSEVEVCLAADETFFDEVILVMLDLPSGYIFVEEITENCQYETWQQRVIQVFQPLGLKVKYLVSDRAKAIIKLALKDLGTNSISDLFHVLYDLNRSIGVDLWWSWVDQCLAHQNSEVNIRCWVREYLLPVIYWQQQALKTKNPHLRQDYQTANIKANQIFEQHPFTQSLSQSDREQWWNWGIWMVSKFQRSSSAVEGRNGYLSQVHHNRRGLSPKRLKVATVIHNFALKRNDGTTAASRLFGQQFPDLFEYLIKNIGELPQPRKSRKSSSPKTFTLPAVPS